MTNRYRPWLARKWSDDQPTVWIMLNPSTADDNVDDPTIRKCIGFTKRWGSGAIVVVNLYDLRATNPKQLIATEPHLRNSPEADDAILTAFEIAYRQTAQRIVVGWGSNVDKLKDSGARIQWVRDLAKECGIDLQCLRTSTAGHPYHPLYEPYEMPLNKWSPT